MTLIPFDDRDGSIWMDGEVVPWRDDARAPYFSRQGWSPLRR